MSYTQKDNSGTLFKNDRKQKDSDPDYNGSCLINGEEMWMSAWMKAADTGRKYMSFSFRPKQQKQPQQSAPQRNAYAARRGDDGDAPF